MRIGVNVLNTETPPAVGNIYDTAAAFMVGLGDWGPIGNYVQCLTINDVTAAIGPRSATNSTLWDSADVYFREGGTTLYLSVIGGSSNAPGALTLQDAVPHPTVVYTSKYSGTFGNTLHLSVVVSGGNYTVNLIDGSGNTLESHGPYATSGGNAPLLASSSSYGTFTQSAASGFTSAAPAALSSTALSGGTDDRTDATITNWTTALNSFPPSLGPGQMSAPGQTNTGLTGIWSALGTAAAATNRVAICGMRDGQTSATLISDLSTFGASTVASYCGFWAGNVLVPSATGAQAVTRTVPPEAVISALCARVDAAGNPNQAAAGNPNGYDLALRYVQAFTGLNGGPLFAQADIDTLSVSGINTWNTVFNVKQNYGFESTVSQLVDTIFWQFNHARFRMALEADAQVIGQPFVFSQLSLLDIRSFGSDLAADMSKYVASGAISTIAPDGSTDQGFVVDTGSTVNTAATMAAGQLNADVSYRPAPYAQLVTVSLNAVPTTASL